MYLIVGLMHTAVVDIHQSKHVYFQIDYLNQLDLKLYIPIYNCCNCINNEVITKMIIYSKKSIFIFIVTCNSPPLI